MFNHIYLERMYIFNHHALIGSLVAESEVDPLLAFTEHDCNLIKWREFSKTGQHNCPPVDVGDQQNEATHTLHFYPSTRFAGLQVDFLLGNDGNDGVRLQLLNMAGHVDIGWADS